MKTLQLTVVKKMYQTNEIYHAPVNGINWRNRKQKFFRPDKVTRGKVLLRALSKNSRQHYYLYIPKKRYSRNSLFISIHGVSRMAKDHASAFASFGERYGVVIVAPLFSKDRFSDYQRLGCSRKSLRSDHALNDILEEVSHLFHIDTERLFMFGYSGGGQFVHRYAMAYPERVQRIVVAAPGWFTFPLLDLNYPYGLVSTEKRLGLAFDPSRFLTIPSCVLVGERDNHRDAQLRRGEIVDKRQGRNRIERGKNWVQAMKELAKAYNLDTEYTFHLLPHCGHSFLKCMDRGGMGEAIFEYLFEENSNRHH